MATPSGLDRVELRASLDLIRHLLKHVGDPKEDLNAEDLKRELLRLEEQYEEELYKMDSCHICGKPGGH